MTRGAAVGRLGTWVVCALLLAGAVPARAQGGGERLRAAKTLFFDRKYAEARAAWEAVRAAKGADAEAAAYWIARCSESLGENERALGEYEAFLALRPKDRALAEEARTSRITLAAKLYKAGQKRHGAILRDALYDSSKTVRYYAALQAAKLGPEMGKPAVPILLKIVTEEKDPDLVDRAKLELLRVDPDALASVTAHANAGAAPPAPRTTGRDAHWVRIRVFKPGQSRANVSINLPMALAELVFKGLPDDVKSDLRKEGYDAENFWERLRRLGPTEIISIVGDDGEKVQIWTEE